MNIYEKYHLAKVAIANSKIKKSGANKYAGYDYYELGDILPSIITACAEYKITCLVSFGETEATLEIVDMEKPEDKIIFTSPMSTANLKGCHPVQNLGAVQSYIRRYLYMAAFEISDGDALDATQGKGERQPTQQKQARKLAPRKAQPKPAEPETSGTITTKQAEDLWADAVKIWGEPVARDCIKNLTRNLGVPSIRDIANSDLSFAQEYVSAWSA